MPARAMDWFREALEDLESAQILAEHGQYHHACFHAQQAAEKAVKAALRHFNTIMTGHSVTRLLEALRSRADVPQQLMDDARVLDQYYIPPRYPNSFTEGSPADYYTRDQALRAIDAARRIVEHVRGIITKEDT